MKQYLLDEYNEKKYLLVENNEKFILWKCEKIHHTIANIWEMLNLQTIDVGSIECQIQHISKTRCIKRDVKGKK